jgi:quercetin dioxygenase-like cupin family protein
VSYSRRDLTVLLPALLAAAEARAQSEPLPSRIIDFPDMPVRGTVNKTRNVFNGQNHKGVGVECHLTELPAGGAPHPPHRHEHVEMILVQQGTMEVTIEGKTSRIGPGGLAYVASNEEHGWRNVGNTAANYFIIAIGMARRG